MASLFSPGGAQQPKFDTTYGFGSAWQAMGSPKSRPQMGQAQPVPPAPQGTPYGQQPAQQSAPRPQQGGGFQAWAPQQSPFTQTVNSPWGQMSPGQFSQQRDAFIQAANNTAGQYMANAGTYTGQGAPPPTWGQAPQYDMQKLTAQANDMIQGGWQNPFAMEALSRQSPAQQYRGNDMLFTGQAVQQQQQAQQRVGQPPQPAVSPQPAVEADTEYAAWASSPAARRPGSPTNAQLYGDNAQEQYQNYLTQRDSPPVTPGTAQPIQPQSQGTPYGQPPQDDRFTKMNTYLGAMGKLLNAGRGTRISDYDMLPYEEAARLWQSGEPLGDPALERDRQMYGDRVSPVSSREAWAKRQERLSQRSLINDYHSIQRSPTLQQGLRTSDYLGLADKAYRQVYESAKSSGAYSQEQLDELKAEHERHKESAYWGDVSSAVGGMLPAGQGPGTTGWRRAQQPELNLQNNEQLLGGASLRAVPFFDSLRVGDRVTEVTNGDGRRSYKVYDDAGKMIYTGSQDGRAGSPLSRLSERGGAALGERYAEDQGALSKETWDERQKQRSDSWKQDVLTAVANNRASGGEEWRAAYARMTPSDKGKVDTLALMLPKMGSVPAKAQATAPNDKYDWRNYQFADSGKEYDQKTAERRAAHAKAIDSPANQKWLKSLKPEDRRIYKLMQGMY